MVTTAGDPTQNALTGGPEHVTEHDISRRASGLYLARDCEHGHDVDDWLQAEEERRRLIAA